MKLYYTPGACSLAAHIILREARYDFTLEKVDLRTKKTEMGTDFTRVSIKGYVPVLEIDSGEVLTENNAIIQFLADGKPQYGLAAAGGTMERVRLNEWLNYISTEVHKGFTPLFVKVNDEAVEFAKKRLLMKFDYVNGELAGREWLVGDRFSIADAYLFTVLGWAKGQGIELAEKWPNLAAFVARAAERPHVRDAMVAEGLIKAAA